MYIKKFILFCIALTTTLYVYTTDNHPNISTINQLKEGNLALPTSQQPGPLFSFGQNIVDKGDIQTFMYTDYQCGKNKNLTRLIPTELFGIRDDLSLFIQLPITTKSVYGDQKLSEIQGILIQGEYEFITHDTQTYSNGCTMVASLIFPMGTDMQNLPATIGSVSFFAGLTAYHLGTEWYCYASPGILFSTPTKKIKPGNQYMYQAGFGKNICYKTDKWLLSWIIEINGTYSAHKKTCGITDPSWGGNSITLCPSLWFSTQHLTVQIGIAPVMYQHLDGDQLKSSFTIAAEMGWKFN